MEVTFARLPEKETKNAQRFTEVHDDDAYEAVGSLYIRKPAWAALGRPETVTVVIKAG